MSIDPFDFSGNQSDMIQAKLEQVLTHAPARRAGLVVRRVLENLVLAERLAMEQGAEIDDDGRRRLMQQHYPEVQAEVDRAVVKFIGAIVSAEGG
ncbi:MAG: hypothetical protein C4524_04420 [Candidatus Zixiibacteriota bacterium]|nr:MAG: hypothetical protein C4524_04420 [candidate division Zixibacteria bacterium]